MHICGLHSAIYRKFAGKGGRGGGGNLRLEKMGGGGGEFEVGKNGGGGGGSSCSEM